MKSEDLLIVCSDHGFGNNKHSICINTLLKRKGLIKTRLIANYRINSVWANIQRMRDETFIAKDSMKSKLFQKVLRCPFLKPFFSINGTLKDFWLINLINKVFKKITSTPFYKEMIDYSNSLAFNPSSEWMGVCVNGGEILKNSLIEYFKKLKYNNKPIFKRVLRNTEIYDGNYINEGPDILLLSNDFVVDASLMDKVIIKNYPLSTHKLNGIFIAHGKEIKKGEKKEFFHITDIAPTILHYLNLPIPPNMDGRVLTEIFEENSTIKSRKIKKYGEEDKINIKIKDLSRLKKF
ncbi:MAG: hypothetical protein ACTSXH_10140, partial [Promethearchaeota archaeon]